MALRVAVANGNWSNPATWNGGVLPSPGDIVASNNFTVTIDQNINVDSLTNAVVNPVNIIPVMTGYTTPSGIASASSEYNTSSYNAWKAFDKGVTIWLTPQNVTAGWIAYEFTSPKVITGYNLSGTFSVGTFPKNFTFEGWNGSTWVVLHTVVGNLNNSTYSATFTNTTAYIKYQVNITASVSSPDYVGISEITMYEANSSLVPSTAGGGFILTDGVNVVCTNPSAGIVVNLGNTLFTYAGSTSCSVTVNDTTNFGYAASNYYAFLHTGTGTLNLIGNFLLHARNGYFVVYIQNNGVLNYTGNVTVSPTPEIRARFLGLNGSSSTAYITGTINTQSSAGGYSYAVFGVLNGRLYITGSLIMGYFPIINSSESNLLSIVGPISFTTLGNISNLPPVVRSSYSAINLFSGPFSSSVYGFLPYVCVRMHLIPSVGTYFEFRDETTNGAVSPGAIAPATRMIAPAGVSDAPIPANVRFGTVYANGSLTGTLKMPNSNSVAYGVQVDNTIGNAVLTPQSVWDFAIASLNTSGSIGERLKKVATVDSTGAQLSSFEF
jgi:hypothetical protein